jgi:glucans biosynthesis protein
MRRRSVQGAAATLLALCGAFAEVVPAAEDASLLNAARSLASEPYRPPPGKLPAPFADLSYDQYRAIRPRPGGARGLALGPGFAADLLPPGLYFPHPVAIELPAEQGGFAEQVFSPGLFSFAPEYFEELPDAAPGAGFSGLRLRHPLNVPGVMDEVLVVQGATYFRAIGQAMTYGLSARAVAIGTGGPGPEEFPRFTRLRLHPASAAGALRLEAVIDSPALAGHFDMTLRPGEDTHSDVVLTLIARETIADIGVAPLTSMFLKGPMQSAVVDDFRPRVHDSNVLVIENGAGERLWRPVSNPARVQTSAFLDNAPAAFGLWQTPRSFAGFEDSEARYHDRPSARVVPTGDWGPGAVMLVEIPTGDEFSDNIVAFWRPSRPMAPGVEYRFAYRLSWTRTPPLHEDRLPLPRSRSGREHDRPGTRRFVVDFAGAGTGLVPDLSATDGAVLSGTAIFALPEGRGTRVTFLLAPEARDSVDLRLVLRDDGGTQRSPVWLYRWTRARDGGA